MSGQATFGERSGVDIPEGIAKARDAITVKRVYGEPYERNGVTVIPAASVAGGGGGGSGEGPTAGQIGTGGGFGLGGRPVGAYVIKGDTVQWQPAVDVTRIATQAIALAAVGIFLLSRRRG
jgi:uncharacterized spore protein YtfJ